jgi:hypothetical protein
LVALRYAGVLLNYYILIFQIFLPDAVSNYCITLPRRLEALEYLRVVKPQLQGNTYLLDRHAMYTKEFSDPALFPRDNDLLCTLQKLFEPQV